MKITFITGANKGLGFEVARRLLELGQTVVLGARDVGRGKLAADALGARFVQIDVTDDASVSRAAADVEAHEGRVDVLINNGNLRPSRFDTTYTSTAALGATLSLPPRLSNPPSPTLSLQLTRHFRSLRLLRSTIGSRNFRLIPSVRMTLPRTSIRIRHARAVHPEHVSDVLNALDLLRHFGLTDQSYILSGHSCGACASRFKLFFSPRDISVS